jgi:hypothetical protein
LPSVSYNPIVPAITKTSFITGLNFSIDLAKPFKNKKDKHLLEAKKLSLKRLNELQKFQDINQIKADYISAEILISEYHSKDSIVQLKEDEYKLYEQQYKRNEVLPTVFFNKKEELQALHIQRLQEANKIKIAIINLFIKSKTPINYPTKND